MPGNGERSMTDHVVQGEQSSGRDRGMEEEDGRGREVMKPGDQQLLVG